MKKFAFFPIIILALSFNCFAQDSSFTINGKFEKIQKGIIYLNIYESDKTIQDSASISDGNFKFTGFVNDPFFATLTMPNAKPNDYFAFYIEPATMSILGRGDSLQLLTVKGSPINDDDKLRKDRMKYVSKWEEANSKIFEQA